MRAITLSVPADRSPRDPDSGESQGDTLQLKPTLGSGWSPAQTTQAMAQLSKTYGVEPDFIRSGGRLVLLSIIVVLSDLILLYPYTFL